MEKTLIEKIYDYSCATPDKTAVVADDGEMTYGQLWNAVSKYAQILRSSGASTEDVVILKALQTCNFVVAELGAYLAGNIVALVEKDMKPAGIQNIADALEAKLVISDEQVDNYKCLNLNEVCAQCENYQGEVAEISFPSMEQCAEIIYTTGTTGASKGVMLSHRAVVSVIGNIVTADEIQADNVALVPMPLNHVFGLRRYQSNLYMGTTVIIQDCLMPIKKFFRALDNYHVTSLSMVPSAISYMFAISKNMLGKYKDQIRYIESSAAPLPMDSKLKLKELLPNTKLLSFYGCTECTAACVLEYSKYIDKDRCAGFAASNAKVYVIDDTREKITEPGKTGRVIFESSAAMMGYWKNPEVTREVLIDGYVYTNDEGYFDEDGFLYLLGRKDDVINVGGNKIAPEEIEEEIIKLEQIEDCACIGIPNKVTGNELILCVKTQEKGEELFPFLRKYLEERVENYKIPARIEIVEEIPRTYNGKLQRKKLREHFSAE